MPKNYNKGFFITEPIGNNEFSFREGRKLYVPEIIEIKSFDEIKLQDDKDKIAFEDFDFNSKLVTAYGLKNFYRIPWKNKEIILFDNHNHAFYFWCEARNRGIIGDDNSLVHVDEHADVRDNINYISKPDSYDLEKIFDFTNFSLNVGDYIVPAIEEGIVGKVLQVRSEESLKKPLPEFLPPSRGGGEFGGIILNLDLDFFEPNLDYIDYDLKKKFILEVADKADLITVATSPFFINQELALKVFKDIFS